ncbi:hypothetical protein IWQ61_008654 [Dispira simplex]|nr:hypothetical protein IWQ61_008654 [Dispira simplex]
MKHVHGSILGLLTLGLLASHGLAHVDNNRETLLGSKTKFGVKFPEKPIKSSLGSKHYVSKPLTSEGKYNPDFTLPGDYNYCHPSMPDPNKYKGMRDAELKLVQVIIRHGDRTPLKPLPKLREHWQCGPPHEVRYHTGGNKFNSAMNTTGALSHQGPLEDGIEFHHVVYSPEDSPYQNTTGTCELEQLTERGMAQHRDLGNRLYQIYTKNVPLLHEILPRGEPKIQAFDGKISPYELSPGQGLFVRSSTYWRTRLSAQSLIEGMYPKERREPGARVNDITYPIGAETLVAQHINCPKFKQVHNEIIKEQPWVDHLEQHRDLMNNVNEALSTTGDDAFEGSFYFAADAVMTRTCHEKKLPCNEDHKCVKESDVEKVMGLGTWEYVFARRESKNHEKYACLGLGWFIRELSYRWDTKLTPPELEVVSYSTDNVEHHSNAEGSTVYPIEYSVTTANADQSFEAENSGGLPGENFENINTDDQSPEEEKCDVKSAEYPSNVNDDDQTSKSSGDDVRFEVYSGHDETVTFFAAMLQQEDMVWPPYASQFILEFWVKAGKYYVRILYNGDAVRSPLCDFEACPLEKFREIMDKYIPTDLNECDI